MQLFRPSANVIARTILLTGALMPFAAIGVTYGVMHSAYVTGENVIRHQPVPFSHKHHFGELGIGCLYCHTSVEKSAFAGLPPTHTCMTCHSQIWTNAEMLEPVRQSYRSDRSLSWTRVNALPDFVYFDHSIHVSKGIGCTTCHGPIGTMPMMYREGTLYMSWCLNCHRQPENFVRPKEDVFDPFYEPPKNQREMGKKLVAEYKIQSLQQCSTCHR